LRIERKDILRRVRGRHLDAIATPLDELSRYIVLCAEVPYGNLDSVGIAEVLGLSAAYRLNRVYNAVVFDCGKIFDRFRGDCGVHYARLPDNFRELSRIETVNSDYAVFPEIFVERLFAPEIGGR